jgi:anti-anti-sigma factor
MATESSRGAQVACAVASHAIGDGVLVTVAGEVDIATTPQIERELRRVQMASADVTVDLTELSFLDCSGLRVLLESASRARGSGGRLTVIGAHGQPRRLFELTRVLDELHLASAIEPRELSDATNEGDAGRR